MTPGHRLNKNCYSCWMPTWQRTKTRQGAATRHLSTPRPTGAGTQHSLEAEMLQQILNPPLNGQSNYRIPICVCIHSVFLQCSRSRRRRRCHRRNEWVSLLEQISPTHAGLGVNDYNIDYVVRVRDFEGGHHSWRLWSQQDQSYFPAKRPIHENYAPCAKTS